jgi:K(+)-stimulated pyrophosphate-energized sodium pump
MIHLLAAEGGYQVFHLRGSDKLWLLFSGLTALLALAVGGALAKSVLAEDEGTEKMKDIAHEIQVGALAYLKRQLRPSSSSSSRWS